MAILFYLAFLCVSIYLCAIWIETLRWHGGTCRCGTPWSRTEAHNVGRGHSYFCTNCYSSILILHPVDKKFKGKYVDWQKIIKDDIKREIDLSLTAR